MPPMTSTDSARIRAAWQSEWLAASEARRTGDAARAFAHLERAHVIGQRVTSLHVRAHLAMLAIGWQRRDRREVLGQVTRVIAAALFSRIWVPIGNTGGADISALARRPLPDDLRWLADDAPPPPHG